MLLVWNIIAIFWFFLLGRILYKLQLPIIIGVPLYVVMATAPMVLLWHLMIG